MLAFWTLAVLMALAAAAFVALPGLARRPPDAGRTALNVRLYRERLAALEEQRREGALDDAGFAALDEEARRELLRDAESDAQPERQPSRPRQGVRALLLGAALAPAFALFVYADWGLSRGAIAHHELAARIKATPADHPGFRSLVRQLAAQVEAMPYPNDARFLLASALARQAAAAQQAAGSPQAAGASQAADSLQAAGAAPPAARSIRVSLALGEGLEAAPGQAVFVYARALPGPPMPLAVQKLQAADLPAEILLDDSSAMMPGLSLSAFQQVQVVARLSATGSAAPSPEDQEARSPPLALEPGESRLSLTIPCCKAQE